MSPFVRRVEVIKNEQTKGNLTRLRAFLCTLVVVAGLLEFMQGYSNNFSYIEGLIALIALLIVFPVISKYTRIMTLFLCLTGLVLLFFAGIVNPWKILLAFSGMNSLVSLFSAAILLGTAIQIGHFAELFKRFFIKTRSLYKPYISSMLISYLLSFLALLGAVVPSYYLVDENFQKMGLGENVRFKTTCIMRGYALAVIVSPVAATVGIALKYSGLSWLKGVGPFFLLSLAGLFAAFFVETSWRQKKEVIPPLTAAGSNPGGDPEEKERSPFIPAETKSLFKKRLFSFVLLFAGVIGAISFLANVLGFSSLNSISAGCMLTTFAWGALSGNFQAIVSRAGSLFKKDILKLADQIILFTAAGFFTFSMEHSGALEWLGFSLARISNYIGVAAVLSLVPLIIIFLSLIGLHPLAIGIIIAKALSFSPLSLYQLPFAVSLISGMSMAYILSPFSGLVLLTVSLTGKSPYRVGLKWNFLFVLVFLLITSIFITFAVN